MASLKLFSALLVLVQLLIAHRADANGLKLGFYKKTCPSAESIVWEVTARYISRAPTLASPLIMMNFHDCFVRGCDGSILINSTKNNQAEKASLANTRIRGFQVIDGVKAELERRCPGVVSCADILSLVARDAISMIKGPYWEVPLGRRDGRESSNSSVLLSLPTPFSDIIDLKTKFLAKGLTVKDLVVLSGAHTIGTAHCAAFTPRLYNFSGKGDADPSLDPEYAVHLRSKCKPTDTINKFVEMTPGTFRTFDSDYYTLVAKRRGLFESDASLLNDEETKAYVMLQAKTRGSTFFKDFSESMEKLVKIGVLTGEEGEIRKHCARVN